MRSLLSWKYGAMSIFTALALAASPASADPASEDTENTADPRIVEVSGVGEVTMPPDAMRTSVSVEVRAEKFETAREEAATKTRSVVKALEDLHITGLQIRTVEISVNPISERPSDVGPTAPPRIIGYKATSRLSASLKGVSVDVLRAEAPRILEAALSSGANATSGVRFFLSNPREAYRAALKASIDDAEKNAGAISDAASLRLVGWRSVSSATQEYGAEQSLSLDGGGPLGRTSFVVEPGDIAVSAEVKARFSFAKR